MEKQLKNKSNTKERSFGQMVKEANQFREMQTGLIDLIELSSITRNDKIKAAKCNSSNYYRHLNDKNFYSSHLLGMVKLIVERCNFEIAKSKFRNEDI